MLVFNSLFSQKIYEENIKNNTFYEIRKAFYDNYNLDTANGIEEVEEHGDGDLQKFKRWEWYWEQRVNEKGEFPKSSNFDYDYKQRNSNSKTALFNGNWNTKGPSSSQGGVYGLGRLNCIAFHPTDSNTFWVGAPYGGLWKTTNNGSTWTTTTDNLPVIGVSDIAVDPINPNNIFIATGDGEGQAIHQVIPSGGIFKSNDGGNTWNISGLNPNLNLMIERLIINPLNPQILIAATSSGVYLTTNGGSSWSNQLSGWFKDVVFMPNNPSIVYAANYSYSGNAQIYKSTDGGFTWSQIISFTGVGRIKLGVTQSNPNIIDALCANYPNWGLAGIYRSTNSGSSFTQLVNGNCINNNFLTNTENANGCYAYGYYALAYAINPNNANEIWLGGTNSWYSNDGGNTWAIKTIYYNSPYTIPRVHADKHFYAYNPLTPYKFYTCTDGGLQITYNAGQTWNDVSNGLVISQIYRIGVSTSNIDNVLCGFQDNGVKEHNSSIWNERTNGWDGMECLIDYSNSNIAYAGVQQGGLYRTTNAWGTSTPISTNITGTLYGDGAWITPYVINPINPKCLYIGYKKVYKTNDRGNTWTNISSNLTADYLRTLFVSPSDTNVIYASSYDSLFVTNNAGVNWYYHTSGIGSLTYPKISNLTVHPTNSQIVWMTYSGSASGKKVYKSIDGGSTWINISGTLPNVSINCIVYENGSNDGLYIGTDVGVFYRDATMTDWINYNNGLPNVVVSELEISYNNNKIWAATFGRGLWQSDLSSSSTNINDQTSVSNFNVFPNPTNGEIIIQNFIDQNIKYNIIVTNTLGQKIFESINNNSNQITIDLKELNCGIYFLNLITNKKIVVKKIILTK